jgi:NitT/TauT family transport system ATP-binding protein
VSREASVSASATKPGRGQGAGITISDVTKTFGTKQGPRQVLEGVSHSITPGSFVSILGKSGCGKSTLLMMMAGLESMSAGQITIDGKPVSSSDPEVGIVFQRDGVFPWRRVLENVEFGLQMRGIGNKAERRERAMEHLSMVGLEQYAESFPKDLSGGMRQRLAIAQTLIGQPSVLLMDEPFGALDALTRETMQDLLLKLWEQYGTTVCFVTHGIEEAVYLSDTVLVMGGSPASISAVYDIDLERPRGLQTRESPRFAELCGELRRELD